MGQALHKCVTCVISFNVHSSCYSHSEDEKTEARGYLPRVK